MHSELGIYFHLPFCASKCPYCDFCSVPLESVGGLPGARRYLEALAVELDLRAASAEFAEGKVGSIYLGGGTPTVLPPDWLVELLTRARRRFTVLEQAEVTVEANPRTADVETIGRLLAAGVNRLSLGVQSFSDRVLCTLGRRHTAADAEASIEAVRAAGCNNLNVDLIYGAPGQSLAEWVETVECTLRARPEHISAYTLSLEEGTPLKAAVEEGRLLAPDEDVCAEMSAVAAEALSAAGYVHYEISNFALAGLACQHNRRYWANDEYLGLGASAHSYGMGVRWNNTENIPVYCQWLERGLLPVVRAECLSLRQRVGEMLILGLRRAEGVDEAEITRRCGSAPRECFGAEIQMLCSQGLLGAESGRLWLPCERWFTSNEILTYFIA